MSVVCGINLDLAKEYDRYSLSTKVEGKKHKVFFKLESGVDELQECINLASKRKDIIYVEYQGDITSIESVETNGVSVICSKEVGNNFTDEDIEYALSDLPSGITLVLCLPDDFNNLEMIYKLSKKYPKIRFSGGNLFRLDGLRLGNYDKSLLDTKGIKYGGFSHLTSNCKDILSCYNISNLDLEFNEKSAKEVKDVLSKPKKEKTKKPTSSRFAMGAFSLGDF